MLDIKKFNEFLLNIHNTIIECKDTIDDVITKQSKNSNTLNFLEEYEENF